MLETTRYIEGIANAERAPAVLAKPLNLSFKNVKCLPFCMAVKRHNHAGEKDTSDHTIIVIVIRHRCEELNAGAEHIKDLSGVWCLAACD
jgi:hypothetical protein